MSADSPRRSGSRVTRQSGVLVSGNGFGQVVVPQPVTDPSIIDSVTGFINDVVPQAYTTCVPGDGKEAITWARFESADVNDPALYPDISSDTTLPLLLVLGYSTGVQVWSIPASGEATEVLSWSQGSVRALRILPSPALNSMRSPDAYASKRPLVALCDSAGPGPGPPFCSVNFISLKTGDQVKSIKFKSQVCDVLANRRSVVVTFMEKIAVFDACTLEDRLSITCCYPSPGPNCNPVTIGSRWLAFAEKKLVAWQRSSAGVGGSGAQSYTATVLHAAQTLGRGLRGLSETVASSLTGPRNHSGSGAGSLGSSPPSINGADHNTPGVVTVLDLEASCSRHNGVEEVNSSSSSSSSFSSTSEGVVAHFIAHSEAIVALQFDPSGMLLLTADRRGHDFHVFRLQPHPGGSSLAAVHHLYVLHRGDTTAKVQDVAFSCDSRWVAVSTMRGTTHVFPLTPYGGPVGFRTHGSAHVVNRLSRFHRSAGLSADGRSSPVPSPESPPCLPAGPHANPRLPPYPHATVQAPLSQLRQSPHPPLAPAGALDVSLRVCAAFASPRTWLLESHASHPREGPRDSSKALRRAVDSLFIMAGHGNLVQYDLEPVPALSGPREKICDDTSIDLEVEARAQWPLQRSPHSAEVLPPLPSNNPLLTGPIVWIPSSDGDSSQQEEHWLSQVEIITHAGPHRRLWMGPQITFKTYTPNIGSNASLHDVEAVEVGTVPVSRPARSNPVNMPSGGRPLVPVLIESGSGSSFEQSPHLLEDYGADTNDADNWSGQGDSRLREDLADAMLESPGAPSREKGKRRYCGLVGGGEGEGEGRVVRGISGPVRRVVNPGGAEITMWSDCECEGEGESGEASDMDLWEHLALSIPAIPLPQAPPAPYRSHPASCAPAEPQQPQQPQQPQGETDGSAQMNVLVTEVSRQKSRRVVETAEPSPVCKKSKKNADREVPRKSEEASAAACEPSATTHLVSKCMEISTGKKDKKSNAILEKGYEDVPDIDQKISKSKSLSPQKDILDSKGGKRSAFVSEKDQTEDTSNLVSKKNKKKASNVGKDLKRDENESECLNNENSLLQCGRGKLSRRGSEVSIKPTRESENFEGQLGSLGCETMVSAKVNHNEVLTSSKSECTPEILDSLSANPPKGFYRGSKKKANLEKETDCSVAEQNKKDELFSERISKSSSKDLRKRKCEEQEAEKDKETMDDISKCVSVYTSEGLKFDDAPAQFNDVVERESCTIGDSLISNIEKDLEEAVDDIISSKIKHHWDKKNISPLHELKNVELDAKGDVCAFTKGSKGAAQPEMQGDQYPKPLAKAWKVLKDTDSADDFQNFPVLSSKFNKKAWALSCNETASITETDAKESPEKLSEVLGKKTKRGSIISETSSSGSSEKSEKDQKNNKVDKIPTVKAKSVWEPPVIESKTSNFHQQPSSNKTNSEVDIDKMTFEDLEAIVDAVCKEEDADNEKICLKENEKEKKNEYTNVSNCSKKGRGKENVDDDLSVRTKDVVTKSEVIDAPKAVQDVIKQEDAVKPADKPISTPNKSSKSQRRKRR